MEGIQSLTLCALRFALCD